jgi:hypothetical protein
MDVEVFMIEESPRRRIGRAGRITGSRSERATNAGRLRRSAGRKSLTRLHEAFGDELPRAKEVGALLEHDRHGREPEARDAADLLDAGELEHRTG